MSKHDKPGQAERDAYEAAQKAASDALEKQRAEKDRPTAEDRANGK